MLGAVRAYAAENPGSTIELAVFVLFTASDYNVFQYVARRLDKRRGKS
jgi:hypothetical protein